ncbi:MAG: type II toxin-antitoxin system prevent-host-death family antitoxin [Candidatus Peribacteraceae bacterium]|nr:type II toxin-antitoxin system prevent-host-death family antitoxin [Candidatus Peribacteraceae bacterium]MDD5740335.1 type II toxin-antitoxin system prevent-host-death family antitoxin [Candidatus Peribacteraceae bacterium]
MAKILRLRSGSRSGSTRTVSIRTFRANMTQLLKEAQKKNIHFVVMRHSEPIAHIWPVKKRVRSMEELEADIAEARRQYARGEWYTPQEARKMLGL